MGEQSPERPSRRGLMATAPKPRTHTCHYCGDRTPHADRTCDDCLHTTNVAQRAAQGLPPTVEDPTVLRQVAQLIKLGEVDQSERLEGSG